MTSLLNCISINNNEHHFIRRFKCYLWGYPGLFDMMCEELRPALVEASEIRNKEKEEDFKQYMSGAQGHADNGPIVRDAEGQDEHNTARVPAQSNQTVLLDDEPGLLDVTQIDARPDSQGQPVNHPPTLGEHTIFTGLGNIEV